MRECNYSVTSEHYIQNQTMVALAAHDCDVYRANVGQVPLRDANGKFLRMFKTGLPNGFSDLFGFKHSNNKIFFIEMKDAKGRPREDQIRFHNHLMELNAIHGIARSPEDALKIIDEELVGYGFND